jgi:hypothetical protein
MKRNTAKFVAEALVVIYMGIIAYTVHISGIYLLLFPDSILCEWLLSEIKGDAPIFARS